MDAIQRLCERCLWLDDGQLVMHGLSNEVVNQYLRQGMEIGSSTYTAPADGLDGDRGVLLKAELLDAKGHPCRAVKLGEPCGVKMLWRHNERINGASYFMRLFDSRDRLIFSTNTHKTGLSVDAEGLHEILCTVHTNVLVPGDYFLTLGCWVRPHTVIHLVESCIRFSVIKVSFGSGHAHVSPHAIIAPTTSWVVAAEAVASN